MLKFVLFFCLCFLDCGAMSTICVRFTPAQERAYVDKLKDVKSQIDSILKNNKSCCYDRLFELRNEVVREMEDMGVGEALADYIDQVKLLLIRDCYDSDKIMIKDLAIAKSTLE